MGVQDRIITRLFSTLLNVERIKPCPMGCRDYIRSHHGKVSLFSGDMPSKYHPLYMSPYTEKAKNSVY